MIAGLADFVERCTAAGRAAAPQEALRSVLDEVVAGEALDWTRSQTGVAEQPLHVADDLTVYLVQGEPFRRFFPHEHRMVAAIAVLEGVETHRLFEVAATGLAPRETVDIGARSVIVLGPDDVHAVEYRRPERVVAVHAYLGNLHSAERRMWGHDGLHPVRYHQGSYDAGAIHINQEVSR